MRYIWGHWLEGDIFLERVIATGDNLEFPRGFDKLCAFCSDDFVPLRNSNSSQDQDYYPNRDVSTVRSTVESTIIFGLPPKNICSFVIG